MGDQHGQVHDSVRATAGAGAEPAATVESEQVLPGVAVPGLSLPVRRAADPLGGTEVDTRTAARLRSPSGGRSMPEDVRRRMEGAFDHDFSGVKVHTGGPAEQLAGDLQATAFTHGEDIYFGRGAFGPGTSSGQHLLAHELTHVVQRREGRDTGAVAASRGPTVGRADDPLEAEADQVASQVVGALRRQTRGCGCGQEHG